MTFPSQGLPASRHKGHPVWDELRLSPDQRHGPLGLFFGKPLGFWNLLGSRILAHSPPWQNYNGHPFTEPTSWIEVNQPNLFYDFYEVEHHGLILWDKTCKVLLEGCQTLANGLGVVICPGNKPWNEMCFFLWRYRYSRVETSSVNKLLWQKDEDFVQIWLTWKRLETNPPATSLATLQNSSLAWASAKQKRKTTVLFVELSCIHYISMQILIKLELQKSMAFWSVEFRVLFSSLPLSTNCTTLPSASMTVSEQSKKSANFTFTLPGRSGLLGNYLGPFTQFHQL